MITRDDRFETVAKDIVDHFLGRGFPGKAMVVSIDKATAVRTFDKVQRHWAERFQKQEARLASPALDVDERDLLVQEVAFLRQTDMAVVISQSQNEIAEMAERGLDIRPHRKRMIEDDLDVYFGESDRPFRLKVPGCFGRKCPPVSAKVTGEGKNPGFGEWAAPGTRIPFASGQSGWASPPYWVW